MAQLEVSPCGPRRRHDLCPLDADPETPTGRRGAELHRRVAGGPAHGGRRPLCRRRGRCQGETPRRGQAAPSPGACADGHRSQTPAGKAPTQHGQRAGPGDPCPRRPTRLTRLSGQARAGGRHHETEAAQASVWRQLGSARRACRERGASSRAGSGCAGFARSLPCRQARWTERRDPAAPPDLEARPGLREPRGTRSPGGSAASAWRRRW